MCNIVEKKFYNTIIGQNFSEVRNVVKFRRTFEKFQIAKYCIHPTKDRLIFG
jgi:hypothetical protein